MMTEPSIGRKFEELVEIMARLRAPDGCPWDREQTHQSLVKYLIEESYEVAESVQKEAWGELAEELGDVLLQVVFHARMAQEAGNFNIGDVIDAINHKMVHRHPHVFGDETASTSDEVLKRWETAKREEKPERESILDGIPQSLPALMRAHRMQDRAAGSGFDWERVEEVFEKLEEEVGELKEAHASGDRAHVEEELGDMLFALVNVARFLDADPETCLQAASEKFLERFRYIEKGLEGQGTPLQDATMQEMDRLWDEAKAHKAP